MNTRPVDFTADDVLTALRAHPPRSAREIAAHPTTCEWREDTDGCWNTACGHSFCFDDGCGPEEDGARWCLYCGKTLIARPVCAHCKGTATMRVPNDGTNNGEIVCPECEDGWGGV